VTRGGVAGRIRRGILSVLLCAVLGSLFFPAETWSNANSTIGVPRPDLLLNHMAERYTSTRRILMEFVDNSFDDAESFFDDSTNSYTRPVEIRVVVDPDQRSLAVIDNCRGMDQDKLAKVTTDVGLSEKLGQASANGQFGFGMQAFRACCERLRVRSRTGSEAPLLEIAVPRNQASGFEIVQLETPEDLERLRDSGTMVILEDIEDVWASNKEDLSVQGCADEIENHFERLLSRGNLEVLVTGPSCDVQHACRPVHYHDNEIEVVVNDTFPLGGGQRAKVMLAIGSMKRANTMSRPPRFFVKGRRIAEVIDTKTFFAASANRWKVWNHPQLLGYIDVLGDDRGPLQPMITRDEFKQTPMRAAAYATISQMCEERVLETIEKANRRTEDESFQEMEKTLTTLLSSLINEDLHPESGDPKIPSGAHGTQPEETPPAVVLPKPRKKIKTERKPKESIRERNKKRRERLLKDAPFQVRFSSDGMPDPDNPEEELRSALSGNQILVNVRHKDFTKRFKTSKAGLPKLDERIYGYLANLISSHYLEAHHKDLDKVPTKEEWWADYADWSFKLEEIMLKAMPDFVEEIRFCKPGRR